MALASILDNLDDLDASLHEHYTQGTDGKFVLDVTAVDNLPRVVTLKKENGAFRIKARDADTALGAYRSFGEPKEVQAALDRIPELEATVAAGGGADPKKIDDLVETRIKARIAPIERERDVLKTQVVEKDGIITGFQGKEKTRTIQDQVRTAGTKAGLRPEAIEDALELANRVFDIDEAGSVVTKDQVGYTPGIDPTVWLTELQPKKPHWWGDSGGGGAQGNSGRIGAQGTNPFTHENWNMTEQGNLVRTNRARAEQMAKAAGTTIGGQRPPAKK